MTDDGIIANLQDLGELLSAEGDTEAELQSRLKRNVYKYTECGAWIDFRFGGITFGSIVEGCDIGTSIFKFDYPFPAADYRAAEAAIEKEADAIWQWTNTVRYYCGSCQGTFGEEGVIDPDLSDDGKFLAKCPVCGAGVEGQTDAEAGLDFPDLWVEHQHLAGWSSAL